MTIEPRTFCFSFPGYEFEWWHVPVALMVLYLLALLCAVAWVFFWMKVLE